MINVLTQLLVAGLLSLIATCRGYDPAIGLKSVYYSGASYCSPRSVKSWTCGKACSNTYLTSVTPIINEDTGTYGFVGYNDNDNQIVVSFRGTVPTNIKNWITDIDIWKTNYPNVPNAQVHEGFYYAY